MEKYIYIGLGIALLIAMIYPVVTAERRRRSAILGKIVSAWGQVPKREYEYSEFEKIAKSASVKQDWTTNRRHSTSVGCRLFLCAFKGRKLLAFCPVVCFVKAAHTQVCLLLLVDMAA